MAQQVRASNPVVVQDVVVHVGVLRVVVRQLLAVEQRSRAYQPAVLEQRAGRREAEIPDLACVAAQPALPKVHEKTLGSSNQRR